MYAQPPKIGVNQPDRIAENRQKKRQGTGSSLPVERVIGPLGKIPVTSQKDNLDMLAGQQGTEFMGLRAFGRALVT